jgi:hypothetical protein
MPYFLGRIPSILRRNAPGRPGTPGRLWSEPWPKRPFRRPGPLLPVSPGSESSLGSSYFGTLASRRLGLRGLSPAEPISTSCPTHGNESMAKSGPCPDTG